MAKSLRDLLQAPGDTASESLGCEEEQRDNPCANQEPNSDEQIEISEHGVMSIASAIAVS